MYVRTKVYLCHNEIFWMPKGTKTLGNSKALAWESRGFVHKKEDVYILTHPLSSKHLLITALCFSTILSNKLLTLRSILLSPPRESNMLFSCIYKDTKKPWHTQVFYWVSMCYNVKKMCRKSSPWGRDKGLLLLPLILCFVTFFRTLQIRHMLFWLAINAQLACKRCPFEVQLTPFWTLTNALLKCNLASIWFSASYKTTKTAFLRPFFDLKCNIFCKHISPPTLHYQLVTASSPKPVKYVTLSPCPLCYPVSPYPVRKKLVYLSTR